MPHLDRNLAMKDQEIQLTNDQLAYLVTYLEEEFRISGKPKLEWISEELLYHMKDAIAAYNGGAR